MTSTTWDGVYKSVPVRKSQIPKEVPDKTTRAHYIHTFIIGTKNCIGLCPIRITAHAAFLHPLVVRSTMNASNMANIFETFAIFFVIIVSFHLLDVGHSRLFIYICVFSNLSLSRGGGRREGWLFLFLVEGVVVE